MKNETQKIYPCPCCGYLVFAEAPGSYEICPICYWEDDISQLRFFDMGGANIPLTEAQKNFKNLGAIEERFTEHVRKPSADDKRDPNWRPLNRLRDIPEIRASGKDYGNSYPADSTSLYYWKNEK